MNVGYLERIFLFSFAVSKQAIHVYLRANSAEGEEVASAHPVNSALRDIEVLRGRCRDGREC